MKMATMRRTRDLTLPGISGTARLDRRVSRLIARLHEGDVAIIDVGDLDRATADSLVAAKVAAVVNCQPSISGRYPNLGPEVLIAAGIPLLDDVGRELFVEVKEGTRIRLDEDTLYNGETLLIRGTRQDSASVTASMAAARAGLSSHLQAFAASTQQHMQDEKELLLDGVGLPTVRTQFQGRHVLLVARNYDFKADIKALKHYIREFRPVLVGIDGGADVLREAGYRADLVIGDMDSMSDAALRESGEVVAHADRHGRLVGLARVQDLRIDPILFPTAGTCEDAAMLLANGGGARLIITVGIRATLEELLDAGRGDMASTVLTRLKVGGRLVDAKAAAQLYQSRISPLSLIALAAAALLAIAVVLVASTAGDSYLHILTDGLSQLVAWLRDLFS
ncbi:MAG: thiamine pyrophosphokinae, catalytic region [Frankiales bacterium]|nr:thiamine pyrophosphokinae, catalytic region [Frankiales bacterium]